MAHQHTEIMIAKGAGPRFLARLLMNAIGLWVAAKLSRNIDYNDSLLVIGLAALIFSVINAVLRPVLIILALPAIVLTLGLFMLVINGLMVWLVSALYPPFEVRTFGAALLAAIIVWIVNYGLSVFFSNQTEFRVRKEEE